MTHRSKQDYSEYDESQPNAITAHETPHSSHTDRYDYADTSMAERVRNPEVETGIPQDLSQGSSKGAKSLMWIGIALIGFALSALGTMKALSGNNEKVEEKPKAEEMIANKKKKDFSAEKLDLGASTPDSGASEPQPESSSEPAKTETTQTTTEQAATSEPEFTPYDRKKTGNVLVESGTIQSVGNETSQATAQAVNGIRGLDSSEMAGLQAGESSGGWGNRLNPTQTAATEAEQRSDVTYLLPKGTNIPCTLDTKIVTTLPGFTRCVVMKDIYSANGKVLVVERGSKVVGEQTAALLQGQARVFVLWNEVETPYGIHLKLASPAAGQLGESGVDANVKYHFWRRFGGAIMISLIGDLGDYASNRRNNNGNGQTFNFDNTSESAQDMATEALKNSINIPPTGYVNQGTIINIMVARDVDFSQVYQRVDTQNMPALPVAPTVTIRQ
jgi:hypothetical protein